LLNEFSISDEFKLEFSLLVARLMI